MKTLTSRFGINLISQMSLILLLQLHFENIFPKKKKKLFWHLALQKYIRFHNSNWFPPHT